MNVRYHVGKCLWHISNALTHYLLIVIATKAYQKNRPFGMQLLGENYIKQMKRDLTPLTFQTSILCQRIGIAKDGFYSSMREGHKYNASDFEFLDEKFKSGEWSAESGEAFTCDADSDVNKDAPICIGMDYNANINWIVAYDI